jgi:cytoskeletal protein RodZ
MYCCLRYTPVRLSSAILILLLQHLLVYFSNEKACVGVEQWCPPDAHLLAASSDSNSNTSTTATTASTDDTDTGGAGSSNAAAEAAAAAAAAAARDARCGFALGAARTGLMTGTMPLPCYSLWTVQLIIRRRTLPSDPPLPTISKTGDSPSSESDVPLPLPPATVTATAAATAAAATAAAAASTGHEGGDTTDWVS